MEDSRTWVEIVAAVVFIALLILAVILITGGNSQKITTSTTITDSYNTYNYNIEVNGAPGYYQYPTTYSINTQRTSQSSSRYLYYTSNSDYRISTGILGNQIDNYEVYVRNQDYAGGYFKVVYYFEDYYGNTDSKAMTYYIDPQTEKRFVYKDVSHSEYKYERWWYTVESITKAPYNN